MTSLNLMRILAMDGLHLIGDRRFHDACQPVVVMSGVMHVMHVGHEVSRDPSLWPESSYPIGGPFTRNSIADLDRMAADVEERVLMLEADRDFWRDMVRRMEPFVERAAHDMSMELPDRAYAADALADLREAQNDELCGGSASASAGGSEINPT